MSPSRRRRTIAIYRIPTDFLYEHLRLTRAELCRALHELPRTGLIRSLRKTNDGDTGSAHRTKSLKGKRLRHFHFGSTELTGHESIGSLKKLEINCWEAGA